MDLRDALPRLLPGAIAWAEDRASKAAAVGAPLTALEQEIAREVGVARPELVRVEMVGESLPMPDDPALRAAALQAGLLGPGMIGLTLGYSIFICRGHKTRRLLSHELRHVHQYEQHGSIAGFLPLYLQQVIEVGYSDAPLERDAREHELRDA
ncbi:MAG TPA: hypothetical protein VJ797_10315 [Burkholderiales bacterium]|nr:hypothetical protein [Burkholderiales bacterium]